MARGKAMEKIRVKRKADQLIISHKLGKDEQLNAVELDIISRGEIPTLTPVQVVSSVLGTELRFLIPNAVPLTERISGDLSFDVFCGLVLGIVETVQSCDSHGIRGSNLELRPEYIFCGAGDGSLRLLYWPLISIAEYANTRNVLKKCGERYRCAPEDASYRDAYLAYFDSRLKFDVFHFERALRELRSDWRTERPGGTAAAGWRCRCWSIRRAERGLRSRPFPSRWGAAHRTITRSEATRCSAGRT